MYTHTLEAIFHFCTQPIYLFFSVLWLTLHLFFCILFANVYVPVFINIAVFLLWCNQIVPYFLPPPPFFFFNDCDRILC